MRSIFALYLQHEGLVPVVEELKRRGWRNKRWRTRKGSLRGGKLFTRNTLHQLLTNVVYRGQIRYRQEVHPGEHPAIVDPSLWQQVQALLETLPQRPCPCGSGKKYKHCCWSKNFDLDEDENGNRYKSFLTIEQGHGEPEWRPQCGARLARR